MQLLRTILKLALAFTTASAYGQQVCSGKTCLLIEPVLRDDRPYHLVFNDEFNNAALDTSIWYPARGVMRDIDHELTKDWFDPDNLMLEDGILRIRAQKDTLLNQCYDIWIDTAMKRICNDFFFSAGEIRSKTKFSHGIFEIRCKLPRGKGLATAFWTYGYKNQNEIDVFEIRNEINVLGNLKKRRLSAVQRTNSRTDYEDDKVMEDCPAKSPAQNFHSDFHVFSVEWTPQRLVWRVDNEVVRISTLFYSVGGQMLDGEIPAHTQVIVNRAFPRNPMEIYVSFGVESKDNAPDESTVLPAYFEVDYVRYYTR